MRAGRRRRAGVDCVAARSARVRNGATTRARAPCAPAVRAASHHPRPATPDPRSLVTLPLPAQLLLVRHGESAANVARYAALAADAAEVDLPMRDVDVPLSERGERQARALGRWLAERPADERPTVVLASPYARARDTARHIVDAGAMTRRTGGPARIALDERLREKELGIFFRLTRRGVEERHPDEWALRAQLGRFYYRPPGGESWADVVLRLRSAFDSIARRHSGERVLVVCHQVVILCFRYLIEEMSEEQIIDVVRSHDVANCSLTSYRHAPGGDGDGAASVHGGALVLERFNFTVPLVEEGAAVTAEPDASGAQAQT